MSRSVMPLAVAIACVLTLAVGVAYAANDNDVSRAQVTPSGKGGSARPLAVQVRFGLRSRADDAANRPLPTKTYVLGLEGVVAYPSAFPSCTLRQVRRGRSSCADAQVGSGLVKGAAGIEEDVTLAESVPCNLRMRVYNIGNGLALRLDGEPPLPPSFDSSKLGCPVAIHTAIAAPFRRVMIDSVPSTELRFSVPQLLLHPLQGWDGALQLVDVEVERRTAKARIQGAQRTVGFLSAVGCGGGERAVEVSFVGTDGTRSEATGSAAC